MNLQIINATLPGKTDRWNIKIDNGYISAITPAESNIETNKLILDARGKLQNLFTPFGDGDMLKICTLLAQVLQLGTTASHQLCLEMATSRAARAIGIKDYGIEVGKIADLVLLEANSVSAAIGTAPLNRTTIKKGQIVARTQYQVNFQQVGSRE